MPKKTFTEEQIVSTLRQVEGGATVADVCRKVGVTEQTFYRWKKKYAGVGIAELRRLKQLEEENRKLKQLVVDLSLDKHMLQEISDCSNLVCILKRLESSLQSASDCR
ncbi:MAG: transposase [Fibrella sp.]|nr:transposase [Armatimonadota bacterium]